jgi:hypothetical protein
MIGPAVSARMKQRGYLAGIRVDSGQVRAFVQITAVASQRQVFHGIRASVFSRHDVLDVVAKATRILGKMAVFATIAGASRTSFRAAASIVSRWL